MNEEQPKEWKPTKEWWDLYLSPPENWNEKYGDAFVWTAQEKMLMQQLKDKKNERTRTG